MNLTNITTIAQCDTLLLALTDPNDVALVQAHRRSLIASQQNITIYQHLSKTVGYSQQLKDCIESTVDQLLDNTISNPDEPGLMLGKVQCGKTRAFVGVMGLAFDKGIDVCVVLTKSDSGLVEQTKARMEYEFRHFIGQQNHNAAQIQVSLVDRASRFTPYEINSRKHILVLHKNTARLNALISLFNNTCFGSKKVLIIDDEADFVSRTYYTRNGNIILGEVGNLIGKFIHTCSYCRYLEVTATPYALFLQPDETISLINGTAEVFRPRFTTIVPIHDQYVGGKQYFYLSKNSASMYSYLYCNISQTCMDHLIIKKNQRIQYNNVLTAPVFSDLRYALMSYVVGSAIRQIQESNKGNNVYHTSFFMHVATETKNHIVQERIVSSIMDGWSKDVANNNTISIDQLITVAYSDFQHSSTAGNINGEISISLPNLTPVVHHVHDILAQTKYAIQIVNTANKAQLGPDGQLVLTNPLNIFIGGFKLDRGITIANMLGFFYGRNPFTMQADTVLQHHRMYGNRSKEDMAVTRLYTTQRIYDNMEWIDEMDHELRESFIKAIANPASAPMLTTIRFDHTKGVIPCGTARLRLSDLDTFVSFKRFTPSGFQTGSQTRISPIITGIDNLLRNEKGFAFGQPFLVHKSHVYQILKNIRQTFIYNRPIDNNAGLEWDETKMIAAIDKYVPADDMVWCYVVQNRNMSRIRQNGAFVDAPEDGNTDTPIARQYTTGAQSHPFLMLFRENGASSDGWRDTPFYWPCLRLPQNIDSCMFCKN